MRYAASCVGLVDLVATAAVKGWVAKVLLRDDPNRAVIAIVFSLSEWMENNECNTMPMRFSEGVCSFGQDRGITWNQSNR